MQQNFTGFLVIPALVAAALASWDSPAGETLPIAKFRMQELPEKLGVGYPAFDLTTTAGVEKWLGGFVPARTPPEVVRALGDAMGEAVKAPDMAAALAKFGNEPSFQGPDAFATTVKDDLVRWGPVVKASGFVAVD